MENCVRHPPSDPHCDILLKLGHKTWLRNHTNLHAKISLHKNPVLPFKLVQRTFNAPKNSVFVFQLNIFSDEKKKISLSHHADDAVCLKNWPIRLIPPYILDVMIKDAQNNTLQQKLA